MRDDAEADRHGSDARFLDPLVIVLEHAAESTLRRVVVAGHPLVPGSSSLALWSCGGGGVPQFWMAARRRRVGWFAKMIVEIGLRPPGSVLTASVRACGRAAVWLEEAGVAAPDRKLRPKLRRSGLSRLLRSEVPQLLRRVGGFGGRRRSSLVSLLRSCGPGSPVWLGGGEGTLGKSLALTLVGTDDGGVLERCIPS